MRIYEINRSEDLEEYKTKKQQEITVDIKEDIEGDDNRGWIVHEFNALVDNKEAGYLKASYIPEERFNHWYPSIFNYVSQVRGNLVLPLKLRDKDWKKYNTSDLLDTYKSIKWLIFHEDVSLQKINLNRKQLIHEISKLEHDTEKKIGKEFNDFRNYFVDKPFVDYISVKPVYQRQRIAIALYLTAAKWFKDRNLPFFASGTQTDSAKFSWKFLEKHYTVKKTKDFYLRPIIRRYLIV